VPFTDLCADGIDQDCDGIADDPPDLDGDGWTACDGDCCEDVTCASNPALVNPGAVEVAGDGVDNDCDGTVDAPLPTDCSTAAKFSAVSALDAARALDLCQTTTANPPLPQKTWGLLSASWTLADGTAANLANSTNSQSAVMTGFGTNILPRYNATLATLSTGMARDVGDVGWVSPIAGTNFGSTLSFPASGPLGTYLAAHGGQLASGSCKGSLCPTGSSANDSIALHLVLRVPTNAQGFSFSFRFFSSEYQSFQCTSYNDHFLALLNSAGPYIPADHNISFDALGQPVSVNNAFFQDCGGNGMNCGACPYGTSALAGTGFDQVNGGATEWLTTTAPVIPGELINLDLMVFDVGDNHYDSLVLLDDFRWSTTPVTLGTTQ